MTDETLNDYREYLGDGLYAYFDGYHIALAASNGIEDTNTVFLEPEVLNKFFSYIEYINDIKKQHMDKNEDKDTEWVTK